MDSRMKDNRPIEERDHEARQAGATGFATVLIIIAAVIFLPAALAHGGHNGATFAGVIITVAAIILTITTRSKK